jgi:hypothetical protein
MTHRSLKPHQPKTTTILRRLRERADQNLSVQPPVIPQIRSVRSRRAATLPTPRPISIDYHTPGSHSPSLAWNTSNVFEDIPRSNTFHPTDIEQDRLHDPLRAQNLVLQPHASPRASTSELSTFTSHRPSRTHQAQPIPRLGVLPSPLLSASGSVDLELQLSTDPEVPHETFLDLQDMRYGNKITV